MKGIIVPKNQLIIRILIVIGVHEFVHYLTRLFESSTKISVPVR